jgi:hypothetical protein
MIYIKNVSSSTLKVLEVNKFINMIKGYDLRKLFSYHIQFALEVK